MAKILAHEQRTVQSTGALGELVNDAEVAAVTFEDALGAVHTLVFHPPGTNVSADPENNPRVVGTHVPHYSFKTAEEAVAAYLDGKVI